MEIQLNGEFTEQDVRQAIALSYPRSFRVMRIVFTLFLLWPCVYTLYSAIQIVTTTDRTLEPMLLLALFAPFILSLLLLILFAYVLWLLPLRQARRIRDTPLMQGPFSGLVTDEALTLRSAASESTVRWEAFVRSKMNDDLVLLYQNNLASSLVPRGLFATDADWQRFRAHVQATVPRKPR